MIVTDFYHGTLPNISNDMLLKHIPGCSRKKLSWSNEIEMNINESISVSIWPIGSFNDKTDGRIRVSVKRHVAHPMMSFQECEQIVSRHMKIPIKLLMYGFTQANYSNGNQTYYIKKFNQNKF